MDQQQVVFDETFYVGFNERRRNLMPTGLKIYVWLGMVFGALLAITTIFTFFNLNDAKVPMETSLTLLVVGLPFGIAIFTMTFLLWSEVKWAIKFNWVIGALWILLVLLGLGFTPGQSLRCIIFSIVFLPYWIWLYRIREKWETTFVRGKDIKK